MPLSIFVINPSSDVLVTLCKVASEEVYRFIPCRPVPDCLERMERGRPDLLILDCTAGFRNGGRVLREIHAYCLAQPTPVIILLGAGKIPREVGDWLQANRPILLRQPFHLERLLEVIQQALPFHKLHLCSIGDSNISRALL